MKTYFKSIGFVSIEINSNKGYLEGGISSIGRCIYF
jgi:hypothetical protein